MSRRHLSCLHEISFQHFQVTKKEKVHSNTNVLQTPNIIPEVIKTLSLYKAILEGRHVKKSLADEAFAHQHHICDCKKKINQHFQALKKAE